MDLTKTKGSLPHAGGATSHGAVPVSHAPSGGTSTSAPALPTKRYPTRDQVSVDAKARYDDAYADAARHPDAPKSPTAGHAYATAKADAATSAFFSEQRKHGVAAGDGPGHKTFVSVDAARPGISAHAADLRANAASTFGLKPLAALEPNAAQQRAAHLAQVADQGDAFLTNHPAKIKDLENRKKKPDERVVAAQSAVTKLLGKNPVPENDLEKAKEKLANNLKTVDGHKNQIESQNDHHTALTALVPAVRASAGGAPAGTGSGGAPHTLSTHVAIPDEAQRTRVLATPVRSTSAFDSEAQAQLHVDAAVAHGDNGLLAHNFLASGSKQGRDLVAPTSSSLRSFDRQAALTGIPVPADHALATIDLSPRGTNLQIIRGYPVVGKNGVESLVPAGYTSPKPAPASPTRFERLRANEPPPALDLSATPGAS